MDETVPNAAGRAGVQRYRLPLYGGGIDELDRFEMRERIRSGEVDGNTEIAVIGSDDWRPAASYPELARYFELAATSSSRLAGPVAPAKPRQVQPMIERIVHGLAYPLLGGEVITLIGLAFLSVFPFLGFIASLATTMLMLTIIRKSADGSTKMPPFVETTHVGEMIRHYLRVMFVTILCMAPTFAVGIYAIVAHFKNHMPLSEALILVAAAAALGAIYYPACLATVAVWDNVLSSLNPVYVFHVIRLIGADYFIVVAIWFVATASAIVMKILSFGIVTVIPFFGGVVSSFLSLYILFYASHLLGYAVYRHAPELGWE